jgi:hypothetical protein
MADLEKEDRVICEFLRSIGPWNNYITIGGGYALIIYKLYLSDQHIGYPPVGTRDLDSLIPRKVPEVSKKDIAGHLKEAGFLQLFKDYDNPATEAYVKEINGFEVEIEFLTDSATRGDKNKNVVIAGVVAQPLSYLSLSLQTTLKFKTYSGETGIVVSPGAWMFHKGLTFPRRNNASKIYKDLYGIWYVASQLGDFSNNAIEELKSLFQQHPKWFQTFQDNLLKWIEQAAPIDWSKLETQDPFGRLKKLNFERIVKSILQGKHL